MPNLAPFINGVKFLREITPFNLSEYQVIVARANEPYKIYTKSISIYYYLHDETNNKLYEFDIKPGIGLLQIGDVAIKLYKVKYLSK
jgi:hypothetical protein